MILLLHISIALTSIALTTHTYFRPNRRGLHGSYALVALTIVSGTALIIANSSRMLQSCMTGLAYLAIVSVALAAAHRKLATAAHNIER